MLLHSIYVYIHPVLSSPVATIQWSRHASQKWQPLISIIIYARGGSRDFKGGVHNQRYTCIHHTECPSLEGGSKSGMITQIK